MLEKCNYNLYQEWNEYQTMGNVTSAYPVIEIQGVFYKFVEIWFNGTVY